MLTFEDDECYHLMSAMIHYLDSWKTECPPSTAVEDAHVRACEDIQRRLDEWYSGMKRPGVRLAQYNVQKYLFDEHGLRKDDRK